MQINDMDNRIALMSWRTAEGETQPTPRSGSEKFNNEMSNGWQIPIQSFTDCLHSFTGALRLNGHENQLAE